MGALLASQNFSVLFSVVSISYGEWELSCV